MVWTIETIFWIQEVSILRYIFSSTLLVISAQQQCHTSICVNTECLFPYSSDTQSKPEEC